MTSILSVMREPRATLRNRGRKICDCTSIPIQLSDKTSYYTTIKIGECLSVKDAIPLTNLVLCAKDVIPLTNLVWTRLVKYV